MEDNARAHGRAPRPNRRSIRLRGYDYSLAGMYFVTICARNREFLLGDVVDGEMRLSDAGQIVRTAWYDLPNHYPNVELDEFAVMPNHVHEIIVLVGAGMVGAHMVGAGFKPAPTTTNLAPATNPGPIVHHGLPEIVRALRTFSARRINQIHNTPGVPVWQRNYYEHIIRNKASLNRIREYITNNPMLWETDRENPVRAHRSALQQDERWRA